MELRSLPRAAQYALFLTLFVAAQSFSMWGQFVTLPFPNLSMWEAYKMAIPFAWADWFVMTFAIHVGHECDLVTPTQDTFLLIIVQFALILVINALYLKQRVTRSDFVAFAIILLGFAASFEHLVSRALGYPVISHTAAAAKRADADDPA